MRALILRVGVAGRFWYGNRPCLDRGIWVRCRAQTEPPLILRPYGRPRGYRAAREGFLAARGLGCRCYCIADECAYSEGGSGRSIRSRQAAPTATLFTDVRPAAAPWPCAPVGEWRRGALALIRSHDPCACESSFLSRSHALGSGKRDGS